MRLASPGSGLSDESMRARGRVAYNLASAPGDSCLQLHEPPERYGHMEVIPAVGAWTVDPFQPSARPWDMSCRWAPCCCLPRACGLPGEGQESNHHVYLVTAGLSNASCTGLKCAAVRAPQFAQDVGDGGVGVPSIEGMPASPTGC